MGPITTTSPLVDARGARVGATVSVFLLVIAGDFRRSGSPERAVVLVFAIALAMAVSAATSLRWNALSLPFRLARANARSARRLRTTCNRSSACGSRRQSAPAASSRPAWRGQRPLTCSRLG